MAASPELALPPRVRFPGLASSAIEHPADRAALESLRKTPGLDRLLRWLSGVGAERYLRILFTGDSVRASPHQCSRIYNDLREACAILDVAEPEIYLMQTPVPNAFTFGMHRFTIVVTTGLVDLLSDSERLYVIGHELGHIKAEHMLYQTMAVLFKQMFDEAAGLSPIGKVLSEGLMFALYEWSRKAELTADRSGLLTVQDAEVCISSLLKLAGGSQRMVDELSPAEFVKQADVYEDMDEDLLGVYFKFLLVSRQTHPFPALRAREVQHWSESEQYGRMVRGDYPRRDPRAGIRTCDACGATVSNVAFRFCPECGAPLGAVP